MTSRLSWIALLAQQASSPFARLDQGALLRLSGDPVQATLYLVGNPVIARKILAVEPAAGLYAPFRVAVYRDAVGAHVAYDQPSSVFASFASHAMTRSLVNSTRRFEPQQRRRVGDDDARRPSLLPRAH